MFNLFKKGNNTPETTNQPQGFDDMDPSELTKLTVFGYTGKFSNHPVISIYFNNVFIGESMFSRVPNGSKIALIYLATALKGKENCFIDCQIETPHLKSMGGRYITYQEYMTILNKDLEGTFE